MTQYHHAHVALHDLPAIPFLLGRIRALTDTYRKAIPKANIYHTRLVCRRVHGYDRELSSSAFTTEDREPCLTGAVFKLNGVVITVLFPWPTSSKQVRIYTNGARADQVRPVIEDLIEAFEAGVPSVDTPA